MTRSYMVKVGFTGTRKGMTWRQMLSVEGLLMRWHDETKGGFVEFHHGDCLGADAEAHLIVKGLFQWGIDPDVHIHPPDVDTHRAFCMGDVTHPVAPYLDRNKDIVLCSDRVIGAPGGEEVTRSGTWSTIRYVRQTAGVDLWIVDRKGNILHG